jgi:class 3 adenylate cyclase
MKLWSVRASVIDSTAPKRPRRLATMVACGGCGRFWPDTARFCSACGSPLTAGSSFGGRARKTVTVVFVDVVGWTELGERLDPVRMRQIMARYFHTLRRVLQRHGGTVEKFIGDAVMAVFGIPVVREEDALRATRAALEMAEALRVLNEGLGRRWGVSLEVRIGVNTGEVVADDPSDGQLFATGDPVNVAARLQQAAQPGEILIGRIDPPPSRQSCRGRRSLAACGQGEDRAGPRGPRPRRSRRDAGPVTACRISVRRA